ncbi:hypothetical protein QYF61_008282 [Mycteria americana]|uniref:Uncharacterized protein n=1 Tax=Mycteria americana TaxID=33587 RepID=A0AAN7NT47_MYCAM|nr:hypothetical protein QYF61_008282 [Mycteria americana]
MMIMASWVQPDLDCSPLLLELLKAVVLGVLVAALMAAQKYKCTVKWAERDASKSLQDLVKRLQAELEAEQKKRVQLEIAATRLQNQLRDAFVRERGLRSELAEARREDLEIECGRCGLSKERELADGGVAGPYPWEEMERAKCQHDERTAPQLSPLLKTEFQYERGVFLTVPDTRAPWSLTQRAGGLDALERGDPVTIPTPGLDQITESVQKAACLQLVHGRHLISHQSSPVLQKANPSRMKPLIKGLPDPLKLHAIQIQDRLRAALPVQERLTEMLTPGRSQTQSTPAEFPLTWGEIAQELISYSRKVRISGGEQRGKAAVRRTGLDNRLLKGLPVRRPPDNPLLLKPVRKGTEFSFSFAGGEPDRRLLKRTDLVGGASDLNEYCQCCNNSPNMYHYFSCGW